jgi:hypothetical protein
MLRQVRGLLAWLRSFAVHLFRGGESQIAVSIRGKEAIFVDDWRKLPEEERDEWEPADDEAVWYTRKSW